MSTLTLDKDKKPTWLDQESAITANWKKLCRQITTPC